MGEESNSSADSKSINFEEIVQEVGKAQRKVDSLSKVVDLIIDEIMPEIFKERVAEAYENTQKIVDHFIRHLLF